MSKGCEQVEGLWVCGVLPCDEHGIPKPRVAIVDNDEGQIEMTRRLLERYGFDVAPINGPITSSLRVSRLKPDIVLVDLEMAVKGDDLITVMRKVVPKNTKLVLFSAADLDRLRMAAAKSGADGYLQKGMEPAKLVASLLRLLK